MSVVTTARLAYKVAEVAAMLSVSVRTVWRMISEGELEVIKKHGTRVTGESINAFVEVYRKAVKRGND